MFTKLAGPPEDTGKRQADQDALLERGVGKRKGKGKHKDGGHHGALNDCIRIAA